MKRHRQSNKITSLPGFSNFTKVFEAKWQKVGPSRNCSQNWLPLQVIKYNMLTFNSCFWAEISSGLDGILVNWVGSAAGFEAAMVFIRVGINSWSAPRRPPVPGLLSVEEVVEWRSSRLSVLMYRSCGGRSARLLMTKSGSLSSFDIMSGMIFHIQKLKWLK